ncbi:MAG TPA: hypothetical protein VE907_07385 [Gammaproteobacteria bacterium]|nr:hypothetical protein [Gammaproteobacteria bacterium]
MGLREENFEVTAHLKSRTAVLMQAFLNSLDSTPTRIKLKNPEEGGKKVEFDLREGVMEDVDACCELNAISRTKNTLEA